MENLSFDWDFVLGILAVFGMIGSFIFTTNQGLAEQKQKKIEKELNKNILINFNSPLLLAIYNNDLATAQQLLDDGADLAITEPTDNTVGVYYQTSFNALSLTVIMAQQQPQLLNLIPVLIKHWANVDDMIYYNHTHLPILGMALLKGSVVQNFEVAETLIDNGADINAKTRKMTLLGHFKDQQQSDIVEFLEQHNANE